MLPQSITDAKRRLSEERSAARSVAVEELARALSLDPYGEPHDDQVQRKSDEGLLVLPPTVTDAALRALPDGHDRKLVEGALGRAHSGMRRVEGYLYLLTVTAPWPRRSLPVGLPGSHGSTLPGRPA